MKDRTRFLVYGLIFVFFLSFVAGLFSSWAYTRHGLTLVVTALVSGAIVVFLALYNYQPLKTERDRERVLLRRVEDSWVESLIDLERFVPGTALLELDYRTDPRSKVLDQTLSIARAFDNAGRSLLILGPEGSGKTVSALMLTRNLVKRALRHPGQPIPVVLSLSSWNQTYKSFEAWLIAELKLKYDLAETVARSWLIGRRLLLVLDGLDEVEERASCVRKIESFLNDVKAPGIVVSSRMDGKPLPELGITITIGELSVHQINSYSTQSNAAFRPAEDGRIDPLVRSPLGLTLMLVVGKENLPPDSARDELLKAFIRTQLCLAERMRLPYTPEQIMRKLRWLARGMAKHRQAIFYIEDLQPSWLSQPLVYTFASRLLATLSVMTLGYGTMLITNRVIGHFLPAEKLSLGLNIVSETPWAWLFITIVIGGLTMASVDYWRFQKSEKRNEIPRVRATLSERGDLKNIAVNVLVCWPFFFGFALIWFDVLTALCGATVYAISFGLVFWFRGTGRSARGDIRTADKVTLTGLSLFRGTLPGAAVGGVLGLLPAYLVAYRYGWSLGSKFWPLSLLIGAIVGGVVRGLDKVSVIEKTYPNQGVWLSLRNTVLIWLVVGGASSSVIWVYAILLSGRPSATLQDSLFFGSVIGMLMGFAYGGLDVVYHLALRLILFLKRLVPLINYTTFLDNVTYLGFLRRVGSGYMFLHGSLREQFEESEEVTRQSIVRDCSSATQN